MWSYGLKKHQKLVGILSSFVWKVSFNALWHYWYFVLFIFFLFVCVHDTPPAALLKSMRFSGVNCIIKRMLSSQVIMTEPYFIGLYQTSLSRGVIPQEQDLGENLYMVDHLRYVCKHHASSQNSQFELQKMCPCHMGSVMHQ